jgi:excisionase family DNA binding protein
MDEGQKLLSAKEAAAMLGVSRATLSRLIRSGQLRTYRIGARTLFSEEKHLRPFLESVETSKREDAPRRRAEAA